MAPAVAERPEVAGRDLDAGGAVPDPAPRTSAPSRVAEVDPLVLARAVRGDDRAFATLVRHYDRPLRALAYRLLGDADRMDDALQEAYVKAYRALPGFRGDAQAGTWLYRIVYNACTDELRRGSRRAAASCGELPEGADVRAGPDERALLRRELESALARLPADQQAVVVLVDAQGFDYAAAAKVLGVAPGTVASRLSRARSTLRAALGPHGGTR